MPRDPNDTEPQTPVAREHEPEGGLPSATDVRGFKVSRTGTALGLGGVAGAAAHPNEPPRSATADMRIEDVLRGFDAEHGDVPVVVTPNTEGHRSAAYQGAHDVRAGHDTLPPQPPVIVDVPTDPIARPRIAAPPPANGTLDDVLDGIVTKDTTDVAADGHLARGPRNVTTQSAARRNPWRTATQDRLRAIVVAVCALAVVVVLVAIGRWATTPTETTPTSSASGVVPTTPVPLPPESPGATASAAAPSAAPTQAASPASALPAAPVASDRAVPAASRPAPKNDSRAPQAPVVAPPIHEKSF